MSNIISALIRNKSLRGLIILIFTVEILFFAIIVGYLSYNSGLSIIKKNIKQISATVNADITKTLIDYLEEPHMLEQIHKNTILNNQIDFSNQMQRDKHFVGMLKLFPRVTNTYVGLVNGNEYGARREDDGNYVVWNSNINEKTLDYYKYDSKLGRQDYIKSLLNYDTRQRPPFLKGIELERAGWTDVYSSATGRGLVITAVYPVYTSNNELIGVLGSSLLLNWVDQFLKSLTVTEHSSIYIIGEDETLIASTEESLNIIKQVDKKTVLVSASDNSNPLLVQSVIALKEEVSLDEISEDVDVSFLYNGEKYLLHAHPIKQQNNLQWISMILIPEKDLTFLMNNFMHQLTFITIVACILGLISGIFSARYILNPIMRVNQMAKKIAEGKFSAKIENYRHDEIGQLICSINEMSEKLEQYFSKLCSERLRNKLLTAGLETSSNLVVILDAHRSIWWVNAAFEKLVGFTLAELISMDVTVLLSAKNDPTVLAEVKKCLLNFREWRGELIARSKNGHDYIDVVSVTPIFDEGGEASYFLVVGQDITERVKAKEAMLVATETKAKAERIFSVGTMAAGISHEINQPLNSIKVISGGILYLLSKGEKFSAEEFADNIQEISSQTDRISNIIKHLRSFIRRDQNNLEPCNINASIEMAIDVIGTQLASHGVAVHKKLEENLPVVLAVPTGLEEIVVNLLVNAMQALDLVDKEDKRIFIRTYLTTRVVLEISDNGTGISPELGDKIFESFTSTKLNDENLGLGLAIVHNIVNAYLGNIEVTSNNMGGATFIISLPAVEAEQSGGC